MADQQTINSVSDAVVAGHLSRWNRIVGKSWAFVREEGRHFVFLHPTKGFRRVAMKRLGIGA
jgi:hypothetical protein